NDISMARTMSGPILKKISIGSTFIYADASDSNRFYYVPDILGFARTDAGKLDFSLVYGQGGNELNASLNWRSSDSQKADIQKWTQANPQKILEIRYMTELS